MTDLRYAVRSLRSTPGFTAVALIVITLGIGATTAIFSVVDAVVLRALPFDEHDRLVAVGERLAPGPLRPGNSDPFQLSAVAPQNYLDWKAQQQVFESMAAVAYGSYAVQEPGAPPEELRAIRITAGFFDVLRIRPALGRAFKPGDEVDGQHRVVILSDGLWRDRFGGDPAIVGRTISLDDGSYDVVGVMPPGATYPVGAISPAGLWVPYVVPSSERVRISGQRRSYLQVVARLAPGVSVERAQAQMDQVAAAISRANPEWTFERWNEVGVLPLHDYFVGASTRSWMLMLLGAVGIVLLIACANVANLLLVRASAREREVAVRAALGAGRWRLIRQRMVESFVLALVGTVLATVLAWWAVDLLRSSMPENVPRVSAIALDLRVLSAAAGLALLTGLLCGMVPALQSSKPELARSLKDGARGTGGGRGHRLRGALVVAEVGLAVVLLVGAALFIGSFVTLMRIDPGFDPDRVLSAQVVPRTGTDPRQDVPGLAVAFADIVERLNQTPGVVHAAMISGGLPFTNAMSSTNLMVPGKTIENDNGVSVRLVTPGYHRAMRIPLRSGRLFEATDRDGAENVVLLNESAARRYFLDENPIGQSVTIYGDDSRTVVGIVGDVHQRSLETDSIEEVYVPMAQRMSASGGLRFHTSASDLVVHTSGDPYAVLPAVRSAVLDALPGVPLRNIWTMEERFSGRLAQRRLNMLLLGLFGVLGLLISAVGIYGVLAAIVSQRTREIGVRMALGATRANVIGMVLAKTSALVALGLALGGIGAWYLSATAKTFLFGLEPTDPRAFAAALVALLAAALAASIIPARRAASVDPVVALRAE